MDASTNAATDTATDTATETVTDLHKWGSREKSSRGSDSPRRPTQSGCLMFDRKFSRPPAELARENFPTAGHANASTTENEPRIQPQTQSPL